MDDLSDGEVSGDGTAPFTRGNLLQESAYNIGSQGVVPNGYHEDGFSSYRSGGEVSTSSADILLEERLTPPVSPVQIFREGDGTQPWSSDGSGIGYDNGEGFTEHPGAEPLGTISPIDVAVRTSDPALSVSLSETLARSQGVHRLVGANGHGQESSMYEFSPDDGGQPILFANRPVWDYGLGRWLSSSASSDHRGLRWGDSASTFATDARQIPPANGSEGLVREMGTYTYLDQQQPPSTRLVHRRHLDWRPPPASSS